MLTWWVRRSGCVLAVLAVVSAACGPDGTPDAELHNGSDATIQTIAGNGRRGFSGDGGPARKAKLAGYSGLAVDREGNVYVSDTDHARVRKIAPDGTITTFAGTGKHGFSGDGGPASSAKLFHPQALAVDQAGTLYIAESGSPDVPIGASSSNVISRIRKVGRDGIISTVFGSTRVVHRGNGRPDPGALLEGEIHAMATDCQGNLYVGDYYRVQRIDSLGRAVTIAGILSDSAVEDSEPPLVDTRPATEVVFRATTGIAVDCSRDEIYITAWSDTLVGSSEEIRRISAGGTITRLVGGRHGYSGDGGPAIEAALSVPRWLALDSVGNLYISDGGNNVIRMIERDTGIIRSVVGDAESPPGVRLFAGDGGPVTAGR